MSADSGALSLGFIDQYQKRMDAAYAAQDAAYREQLALAQKPTSDRSAWLKMAAGFLAPTRTGSFGESLGKAVSGYEEGDSATSEKERARLEKIGTIRLAQGNLLASLAKQGFEIGKDRLMLPAQVAKAQAEADIWKSAGQLSTPLGAVAAGVNRIGSAPTLPPQVGYGGVNPAVGPQMGVMPYARGGAVRGYAMGGNIMPGMEGLQMPEDEFEAPPLPQTAPGLPAPNVVAQAPSSTASDALPSFARMQGTNVTGIASDAARAQQQTAASQQGRSQIYSPEMVEWAKQVMQKAAGNAMAFSVHPGLRAELEQAKTIIQGSRQESKDAETLLLQNQNLELRKQALEEKEKRIDNKPLPAEIASRLGYADEFFKRLPNLVEKHGRLTGPIDTVLVSGGWGEPGALKRDLQIGTEALFRMLTGAGSSEQEAKRQAEQYLPLATDTETAMLDKIKRLSASIRSMQRGAVRNRISDEEIEQIYPPMPWSGQNEYMDKPAEATPAEKPPAGIPAEAAKLWQFMTPEERATFTRAK